ncbi:long-chain-fatty-acid--CoA ligase ACSBG2-like [Camelus ferus]|uniref:Long-chain-fatty-acid--CoA ligase ACSBG2-like n=1 Tax=Camelus ferus TaxID=419612 RepID=A0A8B8RW87_CAMFR|nr:long-chain-fatty-acid--CoA ligase ACSBG2-like [Camelus ferus]
MNICLSSAGRPSAPWTSHRYWTRRDGEVRLRQEASPTREAPNTSLHETIWDTVIRYGNYNALGSQHRNGRHLLTHTEYSHRRAAKAFLKVRRAS